MRSIRASITQARATRRDDMMNYDEKKLSFMLAAVADCAATAVRDRRYAAHAARLAYAAYATIQQDIEMTDAIADVISKSPFGSIK